MDMVPVWDAALTIGVNVLAAILIVAVVVGLRYVRSRKDLQTINALVLAAEQMFGHASGEQRLSWVLNEAQRIVPHLNQEIVRILVEAAVYEMNREREL